MYPRIYPVNWHTSEVVGHSEKEVRGTTHAVLLRGGVAPQPTIFRARHCVSHYFHCVVQPEAYPPPARMKDWHCVYLNTVGED